MSRIICGLQPVREAIRAHGESLVRVVVDNMADAPQLDALARYAKDHGAEVHRVPRLELDRMAKGAHHQGAIAVAPELVLVPLSELALGPTSLIVALDELQDPQNFGAIIRSSVTLGASAVLWPEHRSAPLSMATFRASAGAVEHATLCRVGSLPDALTKLKASGLVCVGLDANADSLLSAVDLTGPLVLVVGAEGKGLRRTVKSACDHLARLPMAGPIASLNASVAGAIALYETARQRSASAPLPTISK
jgi:23S rRNA (guanosine2251-2'-O)-methyltransferase